FVIMSARFATSCGALPLATSVLTLWSQAWTRPGMFGSVRMVFQPMAPPAMSCTCRQVLLLVSWALSLGIYSRPGARLSSHGFQLVFCPLKNCRLVAE